jgi:hypothetical protein
VSGRRVETPGSLGRNAEVGVFFDVERGTQEAELVL